MKKILAISIVWLVGIVGKVVAFSEKPTPNDDDLIANSGDTDWDD